MRKYHCNSCDLKFSRPVGVDKGQCVRCGSEEVSERLPVSLAEFSGRIRDLRYDILCDDGIHTEEVQLNIVEALALLELASIRLQKSDLISRSQSN